MPLPIASNTPDDPQSPPRPGTYRDPLGFYQGGETTATPIATQGPLALGAQAPGPQHRVIPSGPFSVFRNPFSAGDMVPGPRPGIGQRAAAELPNAVGGLVTARIPGSGIARPAVKAVVDPAIRIIAGASAAGAAEYATSRDSQKAWDAAWRFAKTQAGGEVAGGLLGKWIQAVKGRAASRAQYTQNEAAKVTREAQIAARPGQVAQEAADQAKTLATRFKKLVPSWRGFGNSEQGLYDMLHGPKGLQSLEDAYAAALLKGNPRPPGVSSRQIIDGLETSGMAAKIDPAATAIYQRGKAIIEFGESSRMLDRAPDGRVRFHPDRVQSGLTNPTAKESLKGQPDAFKALQEAKIRTPEVPEAPTTDARKGNFEKTGRVVGGLAGGAGLAGGGYLEGHGGLGAGLSIPGIFYGQRLGAEIGRQIPSYTGVPGSNPGMPLGPLASPWLRQIMGGQPSPLNPGQLDSSLPIASNTPDAPPQEAPKVPRPLAGSPPRYNPETATAAERDAQLDWLRKNDRGPLGNVLRSLPDRPQPPLTELQPEFGR